MIIRRAGAEALLDRFGSNGDFISVGKRDLDIILPQYPLKRSLPATPSPVRPRQLYRIGMLASPRVKEGFAWHNAVYELTPDNYKAVLNKLKPDYLLVESCLYDSKNVWGRLAWNSDSYSNWMRSIIAAAHKNKIPAIYWHTMGPQMLKPFVKGIRHFDFVGCADHESCEELSKAGINAYVLPLAFSPEQFNPLFGCHRSQKPEGLLFNGISRAMRFKEIRDILNWFSDFDLSIFETFSLISPFIAGQMQDKKLAEKIIGGISQTMVQELYKSAFALLSIGESPQHRIDALEAAACRCPVLYLGENSKKFVEAFDSCENLRDRYAEMLEHPIEREKSAHLCWREAHTKHTFAHRMDTIHEWLHLEKKAVPTPKTSVIVPSMRPESIKQVLATYEAQTWPDKELIYVFNGPAKQMPSLPQRPDIKCVSVPFDYSTGTAMNAGISAASGDYFFKFDDDDLYGGNYIFDKMIYFNEFDVSLLGSSHVYYKFKEQPEIYVFKAFGTGLVTKPIGLHECGVNQLAGATMCGSVEYVRDFGYPEHVYGGADGFFLLWNGYFQADTISVDTDNFNFCVIRSENENHTWKITTPWSEMFDLVPLKVDDIFI